MTALTLPLTIDKALRNKFFAADDPGASGTIDWNNKGLAICEVVTAAAESRALPSATGKGLGTPFIVLLKTDGGDLTITGAQSSVILSDAGDAALFIVTNNNGTLAWRFVASNRVVDDAIGTVTTELAIGNEWRVWDALITNLGASKSNDDLGLVTGTFATGAPLLNYTQATPSGDVAYARRTFTLPQNYKAGTNLTLAVTATENTAGDTVTVDAVVVERNAPGTDICATAAQSLIGAASDVFSFTLTGTNLLPGETIDIRLAITATADTETPDYDIEKVTLAYTTG